MTARYSIFYELWDLMVVFNRDCGFVGWCWEKIKEVYLKG